MNSKYTVKNAGTDYFNLTEDTIFIFGLEVQNWAGEHVVRVDVHPRVAGNPRKLTIVTETGRKFTQVVGTERTQSLVPLSHFA